MFLNVSFENIKTFNHKLIDLWLKSDVILNNTVSKLSSFFLSFHPTFIS